MMKKKEGDTKLVGRGEKNGWEEGRKRGREIPQNLIPFLICIHHSIMDKSMDSGPKYLS